MVKSGLTYTFGAGFWGANGHDGVWHIALAKSLARGSLDNPVFAGVRLQNYHLGFDFLLALINKLTSIPVTVLYFQILPPLFALLIGILIYKFTKSKWSVFFVYFGGDLAWLLGKGESTFWAQQAISTLINPPFALSLIIILLGLLCLKNKKILLAILFFGLLAAIKIYAAILIFPALFLAGISDYLKTKNLVILKIFGGSLILNLILFFGVTKTSSNLISFTPFWFLETLFLSDRVGWTKFESAIMNYKLAKNYMKLVPAYGVALLIFLVGNLGTRLMFMKNLRKFSTINIFLLTLIFSGIAIPMLFVQKGTPWNTIQFFYYSLFFSGILAGLVLQNTKKYLSLLIILFTIPTTILTLTTNYLPSRPPAKISTLELSALNFLATQSTGIVLTFPFDSAKAKEAENNPPRPLYLYDSTAYVSAYSDKPVFLEDQVNLNIMDYQWPTRRKEVEDFLNNLDQKSAREFLTKNNIKYIYWLKGQRARLGETQLGIEKIFENSEVDVYKVVSL